MRCVDERHTVLCCLNVVYRHTYRDTDIHKHTQVLTRLVIGLREIEIARCPELTRWSHTCRKSRSGRRQFGRVQCLFVVRGESPGCRLISTASMLEWLRNLLPHHSQGSSTERWSRNTLRVVTARVLPPQGVLTSPFIWNNLVETAAPFNVVSHPPFCELRNWSLEKCRPLAGFEPVTVVTKCQVLNP